MTGKKRNYSSIKKWTEKRGQEGWVFDDLNAALGAYESAKREIKVLRETMKEKTENRKKIRESLTALYGLAKVKLKQTPVIEKKPGKQENPPRSSMNSGNGSE